MQSRIYGYARVSTTEQKLDRQLLLLSQKYKIPKENIFSEKISGKVNGEERPTFSYLINVVLREEDILVIDSLSRLGRNYQDILKNWHTLNDARIYIVVDDFDLLDTRPKEGENNLVKVLMVNIITHFLAFAAQREVEEKKRAQMKGIEAARLAGKNLGRPRVELPSNFAEEYAKWKANKQTAVKTMRILAMSHSTFYRMVKIYERKKM